LHCILKSTKTYSDVPDEQTNEQRKRKIHTVRPAGLKTGGALAAPQQRKFPFFLTVLLLFAQFKTHNDY
jgi:hypothetical protein